MEMEKLIKSVKKFVSDTAHDFVTVWEFRPNVLIWCAVAGIILLLI